MRAAKRIKKWNFFMNNINQNITAERLIDVAMTLQSIIDELTASAGIIKKQRKTTRNQITAKYLNILNKKKYEKE